MLNDSELVRVISVLELPVVPDSVGGEVSEVAAWDWALNVNHVVDAQLSRLELRPIAGVLGAPVNPESVDVHGQIWARFSPLDHSRTLEH